MKLYRYEERNCPYFELKLDLMTFEVVKRTPCGYWIGEVKYFFEDPVVKPNHKTHRWVSKNTHKCYAYATVKDALASFIARKKRQIKILENQLERAKTALALGESR